MTNSNSRAVGQGWDDAGGSPIVALAKSFAIEELDNTEQRVLAFLGASVLNLWDTLPLDARQRLLNRDAAQLALDRPLMKTRIARFLERGMKNATPQDRSFPMRPGVTRVGRDDEDFVDRAKAAYKRDGGVQEPAHYSHINEFEGRRVVVLRNKRGVLAVYEDEAGRVKRLARWPVSWV